MLFSKIAVTIAAGLSFASAIEFTSPALNSTISKGKDVTITWTSVDTDPTDFSIFLVNFVTWPPSYVDLKEGIETAAGSATVHVPCNTDSGYGYQFNAINVGELRI